MVRIGASCTDSWHCSQRTRLASPRSLAKRSFRAITALITALRVKGRQASDSNSITFWGFKVLDDVADFFDQSDVDHNREVTYEEFAKAMNARKAADA